MSMRLNKPAISPKARAGWGLVLTLIWPACSAPGWSTPTSPAQATVEADAARAHCIDGYKYYKDSAAGSRQSLEASCRSYRLALASLGGQTSTPQALDMQLNIVSCLILRPDYPQAAQLLKSIEPLVLANDTKNTLLAARFWRRWSQLHAATNEFAKAAADQDQLISILGTTLGEDSVACLDEELLRITLLRKAGMWTEGFRQLCVCVGKTNAHEAKRLGHKYTRLEFLMLFRAQLPDLLAKHGVAYCANLIRMYAQLTSIDQACVLLQELRRQSPQLTRDSLDLEIGLLLPLLPQLNERKLGDLAGLLLERSTPALYEESTKASAQQLSQSCVDDLQTAAQAVDRFADLNTLARSDPYLQSKAMYAWALCRAGKLAEAEKVLTALQPSPRLYKHLRPLSGILQARRALAMAYIQKGDRKSCDRQFAAIFTLINRICDPPERAEKLRQWQAQQDWLLTRFSR